MGKSVREIVLASLPGLMRPILELCLRHSIKLDELVEVSKRGLVEIAKRDIEAQGDSASGSRISVLTGVHRKDVSRLDNNQHEVLESRNVSARVVGQWQQDKRFCSKAGKPRVLSAQGKASEFVKLVQSVSVDLNPYTVLYELLRVGAIERTAQGIKLRTRVYLPKGDLPQGFKLLSADLSDMLRAVEENLLDPPVVPNHHIKTEYDNIPQQHAEKIRNWFYHEGSTFHQKARKFLASFDRDFSKQVAKNDGRLRVALGSFSRIEDISEGDSK